MIAETARQMNLDDVPDLLTLLDAARTLDETPRS